MTLRTRLFLWVGLVFFLTFVVSLYFENVLTDRNLQQAENNLREQIFSISEENRKSIQKYLNILLLEDQARIDSLLLRIGRDPKLGGKLFLQTSDLSAVGMARAGALFKHSNWLDLIQTTKDDKLTALLIPLIFPLDAAYFHLLGEGYGWVIIQTKSKLQKPYLGIRLTPKAHKEKNNFSSLDELIQSDLGLTLFFEPSSLVSYTEKDLKQNIFSDQFDLEALQNDLLKAAGYAQEKEKLYGPDWVEKEIQTLSSNIPKEINNQEVQCLSAGSGDLSVRIIELLQRGDQSMMIGALSSLFPSNLFGKDPFAGSAPAGICRFLDHGSSGEAIFTKEAFFQKRIFNDAAYLREHPSLEECEDMGSALAIITDIKKSRLFIGNTLQLQGNPSKGYLTIAIDSKALIQDLVLSSHEDAFLVHGGEIITAFNRDAAPIKDPRNQIPFNQKMLQEKKGTLDWKGEKYYFLHMIPFEGLDLHVYLMEPASEAFALVHAIDQGSREVIKDISLNLRIIAFIALLCFLIILHRLSYRITKPISQLAIATKDVAEGKLGEIVLPKMDGRKDEIASLCHSFGEMIEGLKEKEKVKGVLNKVVSPEIAAEITRGQVHLGGEEKKITVLFADIRGFTPMTENKSPKEVIELLNTCMTKVSEVIDSFHGVIDKYVGDEVMALFGAPFEKEDSTLKAVQCALAIQHTLNQWNEERIAKGLHKVEMGIGIHTGDVFIGNMGAENRLNYTVIGSNVNLAARLCSTAKGGEILISKDTLDQPHVKEAITVEEIPSMTLKGFEHAFVVYRIKGAT